MLTMLEGLWEERKGDADDAHHAGRCGGWAELADDAHDAGGTGLRMCADDAHDAGRNGQCEQRQRADGAHDAVGNGSV